MDSSSSLYCSDLLLEIFSRCSLKSVDKSKIISKVCNDILYEPIFIEYHRKKTGTIYGYIFQSSFKSSYRSSFVSPDDVRSTFVLDFLPRNSKILASSNQGILCCITMERKERFYVCKPTTRQIQMLPNPKLRYETYNVAMVVLQSSPLRYKIVRLSRVQTRSEHCTYLCEIFDSKICVWEEYKILLPIQVLICEETIFVSGRSHWLLSDNRILCFDLESMTYTIFTSPAGVRDKDDKFQSLIKLVQYRGKLGLIFNKFGSDFEIWELEDYKCQVWKKIKKFSAEGAKKEEPYCFPHAIGLYSGNIALMEGGKYFFYNFEDSNVWAAKLDHHVTYPTNVFPFRSDLEPVDLRGR
ncbi:putative F-box domain-containing protein [Heracleum sosnowskyi]|uniref:F-box domain-containing protein n=1 Tax=Heracleum sosnowskyi TaxID=360622 RepID=A0AAD8GVT3_9APIA|nr:putative F-box domain-containing protein [Heracleum sosnowskyi]